MPKMIVANWSKIDVKEDLKTPFKKKDVRASFYGKHPTSSFASAYLYWNLRELEELAKIFDEKQKEVFKKYDLLKALND